MAAWRTVSPRPLLVWLFAPLPAIALGAALATRIGVSPHAFAPNAAAAMVVLGACCFCILDVSVLRGTPC